MTPVEFICPNKDYCRHTCDHSTPHFHWEGCKHIGCNHPGCAPINLVGVRNEHPILDGFIWPTKPEEGQAISLAKAR